MKIKKSQKNIKTDQRGIASMVIVILIMTLLTLIVLALAKNANREQRQSLDRQLNSQAFYAAESGVSDARDFVSQKNKTGGLSPDEIKKTDCKPKDDTHYFDGIDSSLDIEGVSYSCVMYDTTPEQLQYQNVATDASKFNLIADADRRPIQSLTFKWTQKDGGSTFSGCPDDINKFPSNLDTNCDAGLLRISLFNKAESNTNQELIDKMFLAFVSPGKTSSANNIANFSYSSAVGRTTQGRAVNANCTTECTMTINNINKTELYLHLRSLYKNNQVKITGTTSTGPVKFRDAQMMVDATGKAQDVLKRIRVLVPLEENKARPEFVLQAAGNICKQLNISKNDDGDIIINDNCN